MRVEAAGRAVGFATVSHKLMPDGSKLVTLRMELTGANGATVRVRSETSYKSSGEPLRAFQETQVDKPVSRSSVTATFDAKGANVIVDEGGKRSVKSVDLVSTAPRAAVSEFWFLRQSPKPGERVQYYFFSATRLAWELQEMHYVGKTTFKLGNQTVPAHRVRTKQGEMILDEKGLPLRVEAESVTMIRLP